MPEIDGQTDEIHNEIHNAASTQENEWTYRPVFVIKQTSALNSSYVLEDWRDWPAQTNPTDNQQSNDEKNKDH